MKKPCLKPCINNTPPIAHENAEIDATNGHGLGSTKWNGCLCKVLDTVDSRVIFIFELKYSFLKFVKMYIKNL